MQILRSLALSLGLLVVSAAPAAAQSFGVAPRLSLELRGDTDVGIGVEARIPLAELGPGFGLSLRPSFDYFFVDSITWLNLAADGLISFAVTGVPLTPYGIVGVNVTYVDTPFGSDTDVGINLGVGTKFGFSTMFEPFVELRKTFIGDARPLLLTAGLLFGF